MAPPLTASRATRALGAAPAVLAAALIVSALSAGGAAAQSGTGLYEPFPEAAVKERAQRYVERLRNRTAEPGRRYSDAELSAGVFVRPDPQGPALAPAGDGGRGAASERAGDTAAGEELALPVQVLLLTLALALPAAALIARGRARAA